MEGNSNFQPWKKLKWNGMEWKEIATPLTIIFFIRLLNRLIKTKTNHDYNLSLLCRTFNLGITHLVKDY